MGYIEYMGTSRIHPKKNGFTLAELLVVIAIIGIMFAIALPTVSNITGQTKLESAANTLHSAVKTARQHAITQNQPAYLVFHTPHTDASLAYRAYAVFTIDTHTPPVEQADGRFLTPWTILPAGIVFDPSPDITDNIFVPSPSDGWNGALSKYGVLKINEHLYSVVGFSPTGKISTDSSLPRKIILAEGVIQNALPIRTSKQSKEISIDRNGHSRIADLLLDREIREPDTVAL